MTFGNSPPHDTEKKHKHAPLYSAQSGARVRVVTVPERMTGQLARQGVRSGDVLTVKNRAPMGGPILVEARGTMIALGRALARKIMVQVVV